MYDPNLPTGIEDPAEVDEMDYSKIDNISFDGIDQSDSPDFCDALIISADYDGVEMNIEQLDELNDDRQYVHDKVISHLS